MMMSLLVYLLFGMYSVVAASSGASNGGCSVTDNKWYYPANTSFKYYFTQKVPCALCDRNCKQIGHNVSFAPFENGLKTFGSLRSVIMWVGKRKSCSYVLDGVRTESKNQTYKFPCLCRQKTEKVTIKRNINKVTNNRSSNCHVSNVRHTTSFTFNQLFIFLINNKLGYDDCSSLCKSNGSEIVKVNDDILSRKEIRHFKFWINNMDNPSHRRSCYFVSQGYVLEYNNCSKSFRCFCQRRATTGNQITGNRVTGNHVTGSRVTGNQVTGNHVTGSRVTGNQVTGNHVTGSRVTGNQVTGSQVTGNRVTANHVTGNRVTGNHVTANQVTGNQVTGIRVTGNHATRNRVTGNHVTGNRVTGNQVTGNQVTGNRVTDKQVTGNRVTGNHVTENRLTGNQTTGSKVNQSFEGWITIDDRQFFVHNVKLTFRKALDYCKKHQADIVSFRSPSEYIILAKNITLNGTYWVGECSKADRKKCLALEVKDADHSKSLYPSGRDLELYSICSRVTNVLEILNHPAFVKMIKNMTIDGRKTTKMTRKLNCARDERTSAKAVGVIVGTGVLAIVGSLLVLSDIQRIYVDIKRRF